MTDRATPVRAGSEGSSGFHAEKLLSILSDAPARIGRVRVLVIDQDGGAETFLRTQLSASEADIVTASTRERAREALAWGDISVIVCDPTVAEDQDRFFSQLAEYATSHGIGLVVLRGESLELDEVAIYRRGADASLTRPVDEAMLLAVVRAQLKKVVGARDRMLQDPVTGRPNLAAFRESFQRASYLTAREHEPLALLVLSLTSLREIRREHDPEVADQALRRWTGAVVASLRRSDLVSRGNGDWLVAMLPNTDADSARLIAEKIYYRLKREYLGPALPSDTDPALLAGVAETRSAAPFDDVLEDAMAALEPVLGEEEQAYRGKRGASAEEPEAKQKQRIILAEDDELTASIIQHRLERAGHEVTHVVDGSELMRIAPTMEPALLILDVKIPYIDGFEALKRLRSIRSLRAVPVMMVTSMGDEEDIAHGFELGADDYLVKPFSPIELQARAERLLRRKPE